MAFWTLKFKNLDYPKQGNDRVGVNKIHLKETAVLRPTRRPLKVSRKIEHHGSFGSNHRNSAAPSNKI